MGERARSIWALFGGRRSRPAVGPALDDSDEPYGGLDGEGLSPAGLVSSENDGTGRGLFDGDHLISVAERHVDRHVAPAGDTEPRPMPSKDDDLSVQTPLPYRLRVLSGLHEGAVIELDDGPLTLSGVIPGEQDDDEVDLVLSDLDPILYRFTLDAGVLIAPGGGSAGMPGQEPEQPLPCEIALAGVALQFELTEAYASPPERAGIAVRAQAGASRRVGGPIGATVAGLALSLVVLGATLPLVSTDIEPAAEAPSAVADRIAPAELDALAARVAEIAPGATLAIAEDGLRLAGVADAAEAATLERLFETAAPDVAYDLSGLETPARALSRLEARVVAGGLREHLTLARDGATIVATGALSAEQARFWTDVARWFERRYGAALTLESAVTVREPEDAAAPRIGLQAVWVGPDPYLIAADGRRSRPGDRLRGGWRVESITPERVRLTREGRTHDIDLTRLAAAAETSE